MTAAAPHHTAEKLCRLLSDMTGQTVSEGRRWRIESSLRPLLRARGLTSLDALIAAIERDPGGPLAAQAVDAMLNHESSFFRDIGVFRTIEQSVLPRIRDAAREKLLRIWCAGASTGQEAYSLAMMLKRMGPMWDDWRISIHATDVSPAAIETARRGRYTQMDMQRGLPINELLRWFTAVGDDWQLSDEIREMVSFSADNLLDPRRVSGLFDLILCRNVLFYFPEETKRAACARLAAFARPGTYLVLGAGEMLTGLGSRFVSCRDLNCIYIADRRSDPTRPDRYASETLAS
ncbi:MAG: protein-glutamate O-methyltransferase [Sphingobium sp. 66-54]|nr:MAG: protein-glutamate O-methyltransferase [Sphingobium sp. 66-54]